MKNKLSIEPIDIFENLLTIVPIAPMTDEEVQNLANFGFSRDVLITDLSRKWVFQLASITNFYGIDKEMLLQHLNNTNDEQ